MPRQNASLASLWPKPNDWRDIIPEFGAERAVLMMVIYGNLAKQPHVDGWLGISGEEWNCAYVHGIRLIRSILSTSESLKISKLAVEFNARMKIIERSLAEERPKPKWIYGAGIAGKYSTTMVLLC